MQWKILLKFLIYLDDNKLQTYFSKSKNINTKFKANFL